MAARSSQVELNRPMLIKVAVTSLKIVARTTARHDPPHWGMLHLPHTPPHSQRFSCSPCQLTSLVMKKQAKLLFPDSVPSRA